MSFLKKLRDTFYITGRSSSMRTTTSEAPYVISSTFENPSFRPGDENGEQITEQDQSHERSWINVSAVTDPADSDGSLSGSLLSKEVKYDSEKSSQAEEINRDNTDSLNSFGSTSSRQRIFRQGKPPKEFSRLDFQNKYAARKGHQMNLNFENESYDSNGENSVSRPSSQGNNFRILEDGERPGSSGSKHNHKVVDDGERPGPSGAKPDLSKSLRDVIRHQRRPNFNHVSGDNTTNNKEISSPKPRRGISWLKFAVLASVILGAVTAIIILIIELRDPTKPGGQHGCTALTVNLKQPIVIVCYTSYIGDCIISITPPSTVNLGQMALLTKQERNNSGWTINYISNKNITLIGPEAKCSSEGNYTINITDTVERLPSIQITNLKISESPELETSPRVSTPNASKEASCISQTQCKEGYTLKMLPPKNSATEFNQTCYVHFSDSVGWTTHCTGQLQSYKSNASCTSTCILSNNIITKTSNVNIC